MSATRTASWCKGDGVKARRQGWQAYWVALALVAVGSSAAAQGTNSPASTNPPAPAPPTQATATQDQPAQATPAPSRLDESAFRIVSERNIFDANRSGGQVRLASRRAPRVESFTLVGTMAYEKGAFAFFEGSSSELTKALKAEGVIAGHKLVDILADGVKLEADGKMVHLAVGSAMRREDEGAWRLGEAIASNGGGSARRGDDDSSRSQRRDDRDNTAEAARSSAAGSTTSSADQAEILKRLMERREKE